MIAVIDIVGNNLTSLLNAIKRLGFSPVLTHCENEIKQASHVILPGVGAAAPAMQSLHAHHLVPVLTQLTQPLLGICLGMQLLYEQSDEGHVDCLGLIPGHIQRLSYKEHYPVPHMGWNHLHWHNDSFLKQGISDHEQVYFVHSYAALSNNHALARCQYSHEFTAIVQKNNVFGMQFHPEKSANTGLKLLNNFLTQSWEKAC
ncbi:imidazole glycerol phosphate synthase subunit HisH [Legionella oakridgensis]|uniref:Imidazole glycerol phosphate synthase subunit HisH n=1 Tax=Legionella oakridgensis TaxID=29423 RepID=A0A0W0WZN5_9GAMM|nr:imidazole glycerol phosphate synthase subunit HisH [Legionella oakridgensis]KTD37777.1 imidazole glycerol phosphate synthase subunit HisH [Legionella oakridgensis]STY19771.1 imidazole glycerol phosphate synthase subunit HisH [Legionella longbeachae]